MENKKTILDELKKQKLNIEKIIDKDINLYEGLEEKKDFFFEFYSHIFDRKDSKKLLEYQGQRFEKFILKALIDLSYTSILFVNYIRKENDYFLINGMDMFTLEKFNLYTDYIDPKYFEKNDFGILGRFVKIYDSYYLFDLGKILPYVDIENFYNIFNLTIEEMAGLSENERIKYLKEKFLYIYGSIDRSLSLDKKTLMNFYMDIAEEEKEKYDLAFDKAKTWKFLRPIFVNILKNFLDKNKNFKNFIAYMEELIALGVFYSERELILFLKFFTEFIGLFDFTDEVLKDIERNIFLLKNKCNSSKRGLYLDQEILETIRRSDVYLKMEEDIFIKDILDRMNWGFSEETFYFSKNKTSLLPSNKKYLIEEIGEDVFEMEEDICEDLNLTFDFIFYSLFFRNIYKRANDGQLIFTNLMDYLESLENAHILSIFLTSLFENEFLSDFIGKRKLNKLNKYLFDLEKFKTFKREREFEILFENLFLIEDKKITPFGEKILSYKFNKSENIIKMVDF